MKKNLLEELEEFVNEVLDISGTIALENFREIRGMTLKGDSSTVTKADMEIEQYIRTKILEKYPNHNIVGEELDYVDGSENVTWYIDPIDGTRSFVAGMPIFGTLISLLDHEVPLFGIIDVPIIGERWLGIRNKECLFYNNQETGKAKLCKASGQKKIEQSILYSVDPAMFNTSQKPNFDRISY